MTPYKGDLFCGLRELLPSEVKRLRQLDEENNRLKRIVADLPLDKEMLQEARQMIAAWRPTAMSKGHASASTGLRQTNLQRDPTRTITRMEATYKRVPIGGRGGQATTAEMGEAGYWIALLQFGGFLVGGLCTFLFLKDKPVCGSCQKYYRPLASVTKDFSEHEKFVTFYEGLFRIPVDTPLFANAIRAKTEKVKVKQGTINHNLELIGCPGCKEQIVIENIKVFNGSDWKEIWELTRRARIPQEVNLIPIFRR